MWSVGSKHKFTGAVNEAKPQAETFSFSFPFGPIFSSSLKLLLNLCFYHLCCLSCVSVQFVSTFKSYTLLISKSHFLSHKTDHNLYIFNLLGRLSMVRV